MWHLIDASTLQPYCTETGHHDGNISIYLIILTYFSGQEIINYPKYEKGLHKSINEPVSIICALELCRCMLYETQQE